MYNFREGSLGLFEGEFGEFRPFLSVLARISGLAFSLGTLCQSPLGLGSLWLSFGAVLGIFDPSKRLWKVPRIIPNCVVSVWGSY